MVRFSQTDLDNYQARQVRQPAKVDDGEAKESDLHDKILAECKRRGWVAVHSRMDKATTTASGVFDFIIFADKGRIFVVEAKSKIGKLSPAQSAFMCHLSNLGHGSAAVRSFREFVQWINADPDYAKSFS